MIRISWLCLGLLGAPAMAFQPPLTNVDAVIETNGLHVRVVLKVLDPALDKVIEKKRQYDGSLIGVWTIPELVVSSGVVAWRAEQEGASSSRDREVAYAVYDPDLSRWQLRWITYSGGSLNFWTPSSLLVESGSVAWKSDLTDAISSRDSEINVARYDPRQRDWVHNKTSYRGTSINYWMTSDLNLNGGQALWHALNTGSVPTWKREIAMTRFDPATGSWMKHVREYTGTTLNFWTVADLVTADGMVAWHMITEGAVSPFDHEVGYAIYDPALQDWPNGRQKYDGQINDLWTVTNLNVQGHVIEWETIHRDRERFETRGYDASLAAWDSGPTMAKASFMVSTNQGNLPLGVWFSDQSLGADTWIWDFGDGFLSTDQCPYHVYERVGVFTVKLTVSGPEGADAVSQIVAVGVSPGDLRFIPETLAFAGGTFSAVITGLSEDRPLVVQGSTNLVDWFSILTNAPAAGEFQFIDPVGAGQAQRFYRAFLP